MSTDSLDLRTDALQISIQADKDYIASILELMAQKQFLPANMDSKDRQALENDLAFRAGQLITEYERERLEIDRLAPDDKRRREFEKNTENLAKALPNLTKGTLAAIAAYQKGDALNGTAAVMDICASLAPLLGGLASAGGPPGMLVGAIFSMIGQILSFFAPKSDSLTTQIEKLLRELQAEATVAKIKSAHTTINNYAVSLRRVSNRVNVALANSAVSPVMQIGVVKQIINDFNPIDGNAMTSLWDVAEWLQEPNNRDVELWPVILAAVCSAYTDLVLGVINLMSHISSDTMQRRWDEAEELPDQDKKDVRTALRDLLTLGIARLVEYGACNDAQLRYLKSCVPVAQDRGMLWQLDDSSSKHLWAGTSIRKGEFKYLGGEQKRIAVAVTRKDIDSDRPTYHVLALENGSRERTYHGVVKPAYTSMNSVPLDCADFSLQSLSDIWAMPGNAHNADTDILLYGAKGREIRGLILAADNKVRLGYGQVVKSSANSVRVIQQPRSFDHDPDVDPKAPGLAKVDWMTYAGLAASPEIYVDLASKHQGYVRAPWPTYTAVRVDQDYLWVFGWGGFACATHASVMRCLTGGRPVPRWIHHYPNELLFTDAYRQNEKKVPNQTPPLGVVDLSPCDDGTVSVALYTRTVAQLIGRNGRPTFYFSDINGLYSGVHLVDLKAGTMRVSWTKLGRATGVAVHKTPVFCWSSLESLMGSLERLSPMLEPMKARYAELATLHVQENLSDGYPAGAPAD